MRGGKPGSLKGKNKWARPEGGSKSAPVPPNPLLKPNPAADAGHEQKPAFRKVGKFALARDLVPKPTAAASPASLNRGRFTYERPKDSAAPAAAAAAQHAVQKVEKKKSIVRPGKLRWNKYVRQSIGGEKTGKQPAVLAAEAAATAAAPPLSSPAPPTAEVAATPLSAAELHRRKRSKRISAASELVRRYQGRKLAQPSTQRAMQLLRLGGQLYSRGGQKGKGRSLKLQNNVNMITNSTHSTVNKSLVKPKPLPCTSALKPATAVASSSRSNLLSTRSASKQVAPHKQQNAKTLKQKKPMSRLKGGRLVYCPVYCHTGRCPRRGRGCPLRHDPTKRAVCPLWLRGKCAIGATCPLQHQRRSELMPACVHYLQGRCTNAHCPYLHVDLPADAPHCAAFLRGYCAAGVKCASKHYTLKQIKEERKLVAGKEGGVKKKKELKKHQDSSGGSGGGGTDEKPKKRKRRRGRYFDQLSFDEEEKAEKQGEDDDSFRDNKEEDEDEEETLSSTTSSSDESTDADTDAEAIEEGEHSGETSEDQEEEEDQPPRKQSRRLTGTPLPDFIGL